MRYYGIRRKRNIEKTKYKFVKFKYFISQYTTLNKTRREHRKFAYVRSFVEPHLFRDEDSTIPEGKYYLPVCVITSDLVLRENIPQLKSGLIRLLKKHYSHKFLGGQRSIDEILKNIENMDDTLTSWYDWIDIGRFDFEKDRIIKQQISYFDVYIKNINSSYLSMEFHLYITDNYRKEQSRIIDNNYVNIEGYIMPGFTQNHRISGGKRTHGVGHYNNAHLKSDLIYENIAVLKWQFYNRIQKYFLTTLHQKAINPPSINIYKTNIHYTDKNTRDFWDSVGILSFQGQFIDESRKLFFKTNLSGRYEHKLRTDLIYVVNDMTMEKSLGYYSTDFQIVCEFKENLSTSIFKFALLDALNEIAAKELITYKLKLNKIKLGKNRLNGLLRLRYFYEKDMDYYRRYVCDDIWERAQNNLSKTFDDKKLKRSFDYRVLSESPIMAKNKIIEQINVLSQEFNDKTSILQHLAAYKNENRSKTINYIMLVLAAATLIFVIYPDLANVVGERIIKIWGIITSAFS
jgi:hypothetical protein